MPENNNLTIYPCPLSKGYGIPEKQAWLLLKIYFGYRLFLSLLFISLSFLKFTEKLAAIFNSPLYYNSASTYLLLTLISGFLLRSRIVGYIFQAQLLLLTDLILLVVIMHVSGGIKSGIGILLAVSVAYGGVVIGGRCAMFYAAMASLAVLTHETYLDLIVAREDFSYTYAGLHGAAFMTIALVSFVLASRSENLLALATQQEQTIANLEELNDYIIQHLQTGIIITDRKQKVQWANATAMKLLRLMKQPKQLLDISPALAAGFYDWQHYRDLDQTQVVLPDQSEIRIRFMMLPTGGKAFYMVILEDVALYNQQVQQSKLASLGRLTASIAHEIRNPLSAISHAGQLLSENPNFAPEDKRLTQIIQTNTERVNHIIEDVLQLSKRSASRREKIDLSVWLTHYLATFLMEHLLEIKTFRLVVDPGPIWVFVDVGHLKQILDNLCHNAVQYGRPERGPIVLHGLLRKNLPCVEVIDNGPGIAREHLSHIFEPFFTTSSKGTGLGLYISKELAELNQAKLGYHLLENKHGCFRLYLSGADTSIQ